MTNMNKLLASSMKEMNEEIKHARKNRDNLMLKDIAIALRAMAAANMAKDSHRQHFNTNSNKVTIKNVSAFEEDETEHTEKWIKKT